MLCQRVRHALPSKTYLKTYGWILFNFALVLLIFSCLLGRYIGADIAIWGSLGIAAALIYIFAVVLVVGVVLHVIDKER